MKKLLILLTLAIFSLFSCTTTGKDQNSSSSSTQVQFTNAWYELVGIDYNGSFIVIEPGHGGAGLIKFNSNGSLETTSGINSGTGAWKYKTKNSNLDSFTITNLSTTKNKGDNAQATNFDVLFFELLRSSAYINIDGKIINLYNGNNVKILSFYKKN